MTGQERANRLFLMRRGITAYLGSSQAEQLHAAAVARN